MAKPQRQTLITLESLTQGAAKDYHITRDAAGRLFCNCPSFIFGKVRTRDGSRGCKHTQIVRLAIELAPALTGAAVQPFKPDQNGDGPAASRVYFDDAE